MKAQIFWSGRTMDYGESGKGMIARVWMRELVKLRLHPMALAYRERQPELGYVDSPIP